MAFFRYSPSCGGGQMTIARNRTWQRTVAAAFCLVTTAVTDPIAAQAPGRAELSFVTPERLTLREPVVATFRILNATPGDIAFDMGEDGLAHFRIQVTKPHGAKVIARPVSGNISAIPGESVLRPNRAYVQGFVVSEWAEFDEVGVYRLSLTFEGRVSKRGGVLTVVGRSYEAQLEIAPIAPEQLRQTCARLVDEVKRSPNASPRLVAAKALVSVNDPIAIPYLVLLVQSGNLVSEGISRIARKGTIEAQAALAVLAKEPDPFVAAMAKDALARKQ